MNVQRAKFCLLLLLGWMQSMVMLAQKATITPAATANCSKDCSFSNNMWLPRAFSSYSMHDIYQEQSVCGVEDHKLNFTFYTEYMRNFGGKCAKGCKNLGSRPFWSGDNTLTIGNNDGRADLDAYQLGFGDIQVNEDGIGGIIQLNPQVQHVGSDFMMYYLQHKDEKGLFFKLHAPLVAMTIRPRLKELMVANSTDDLSFTQTTVAGVTPASNITYQFTSYPTPDRRSDSISEILHGGASGGNVFKGNLSKPIRVRKGRIAADKLTSIRLADITTSLGYNFFANEKGFVGVGVKASCPTGNVPTADYMLEPIVGRAGLWGVGGELSASYNVWNNKAGSSHLVVRAQGEVMHLFSGRAPNFRTFDLKKNGPGSKYLLVQNYVSVYSNSNPNTQVMAPFLLEPASNITTVPVLSTIAVEGSFALMVDFQKDNWNAAVGAEFWGRSREKLSVDQSYARDLRLPNLNEYAVLGRQISAYQIDGTSVNNPNPVEAYYCQPEAKINESLDPALLSGTVPSVTTQSMSALPAGIADARDAANRIPGDVNEAFDIAGAQAGRAFTAKVTGEVGYSWSDRHHMPSIALTGGAELTNKTNNAVQYWSVGLVGSLNF